MLYKFNEHIFSQCNIFQSMYRKVIINVSTNHSLSLWGSASRITHFFISAMLAYVLDWDRNTDKHVSKDTPKWTATGSTGIYHNHRLPPTIYHWNGDTKAKPLQFHHTHTTTKTNLALKKKQLLVVLLKMYLKTRSTKIYRPAVSLGSSVS